MSLWVRLSACGGLWSRRRDAYRACPRLQPCPDAVHI